MYDYNPWNSMMFVTALRLMQDPEGPLAPAAGGRGGVRRLLRRVAGALRGAPTATTTTEAAPADASATATGISATPAEPSRRPRLRPATQLPSHELRGAFARDRSRAA